ncbi:MAG: TetR/AcrR family transcriptional regulator [Spirochaetota bacterium]
MDDRQQEVKQRILQAAIELIREVQAFEKVSMRKIAERAGVAVSMVNYHFQTKENLINRAVQSYIGRVIAGSENSSEAGDAAAVPGEGSGAAAANAGETRDPVERMRRHLKQAADFIAAHPGISRVSILRDMQGGSSDDNTSQVAAMVMRQLSEIYPQRAGSTELKVQALVQVAAVQHLFLRAELNKEQLGLDFFEKEQRDALMDMVIDTVTGGG